MELTLMVGVGDQLAATPIVREIKRALPDENVRIFEPSRADLWQGNPHLNHGNRENGLRVHLSSPGAGQRIATRYAQIVAAALKMPDFFRGADDTPELFLTDDERNTSYGVDRTKSVAINAEAGWSTRQWPYFHELASMLIKRGWKVYHVGRDGTPALPCTRSFHNKLTLRETAALLGQVGRIVCSDTGLMHVAAAVGATCVVPFGFIPACDRMYATTRAAGRQDTKCERRCDFTQCIKSARCAKLDAIPVRDVFSEVVR